MSKKNQLINLYKSSFDDSEEYIENFFNEYYVSRNVMSFTDNGKILSALYLMPKNLSFYSKIWRLPYVVGAATLKEYREQGYFSKLIKKSFSRLMSTNTPFVMLYPSDDANRKMYEKFNFATVSFAGKTTLRYDGTDSTKVDASIEQLTTIFVDFCAQHAEIGQYRNVKEMEKICERWAAENIFVETYERDGKLCYIAFNDKEIEEVIGDISVLNGVKKFDGKVVDDFLKHDEPYSMARVISPVKLLESLLYCADGEFKFKVTDSFFVSNNVALCLKIRKGAVTVTHAEKYDFEISVVDLIKLAFGQKVSCPLDNVLTSKKVIFVDKY